jgi:putative transposase
MDSAKRKSLRLSNYDYPQSGAYFVTICTHERKHLFGEIKDGVIGLNDLGCMVFQCWNEIPSHFENVNIAESMVMPNHFHGVLILSDRSGTACRAPTREIF